MNIPDWVGADLLAAARLASLSDGSIVLAGEAVCRGPLGDRRAVLPQLAEGLYSRWFADWMPPRERGERDGRSVAMRMRAVHAGTRRFEAGWTARRAFPGGRVDAVRGGEAHYAESGDYVNLTHPGVPVQPGDAMALVTRRDGGEGSEGWWQTWAASGPAPEREMLRIYWNCGEGAAAELVAGITSVLEEGRARYTLKCPSEPELFGRRDAVVLYLTPEVWAAAKRGLRAVHVEISKRLGESTPPLTLRLGRGVALAEDPENGHSFGTTMAWAVADGLLRVLVEGRAEEEEIVQLMGERLVARGIAPEQPYRKVGSLRTAVEPW